MLHSTSSNFCIDCSKDIKSKNPLCIKFDESLGKMVSPETQLQYERWEFIGSECAKKYPKSWLRRASEIGLKLLD